LSKYYIDHVGPVWPADRVPVAQFK